MSVFAAGSRLIFNSGVKASHCYKCFSCAAAMYCFTTSKFRFCIQKIILVSTVPKKLIICSV